MCCARKSGAKVCIGVKMRRRVFARVIASIDKVFLSLYLVDRDRGRTKSFRTERAVQRSWFLQWLSPWVWQDLQSGSSSFSEEVVVDDGNRGTRISFMNKRRLIVWIKLWIRRVMSWCLMWESWKLPGNLWVEEFCPAQSHDLVSACAIFSNAKSVWSSLAVNQELHIITSIHRILAIVLLNTVKCQMLTLIYTEVIPIASESTVHDRSSYNNPIAPVLHVTAYCPLSSNCTNLTKQSLRQY